MQQHRDFVARIGDQGQDDSEAFFEMANLFPRHPGLPFVVWISYRGGAQHDVRVKVSHGPRAVPSEMASVAIRPQVRVVQGVLSATELSLLTRWIELNQDVLVRYWDGEIDTKDALDAIRPLD